DPRRNDRPQSHPPHSAIARNSLEVDDHDLVLTPVSSCEFRPANAVIDCADRPLGIRGADGLKASPDRSVSRQPMQRPRRQYVAELLTLVELLRQAGRVHPARKGRVSDRDIVSLRGRGPIEIAPDFDAQLGSDLPRLGSYIRERPSETAVNVD